MVRYSKTDLIPKAPRGEDIFNLNKTFSRRGVWFLSAFILIAALILVWLFWFSSPKQNDKSFMTEKFTPEERVDKIVERVDNSTFNQLQSDEAVYILDWVSSDEGRSVKISEDEARKIIDALNR